MAFPVSVTNHSPPVDVENLPQLHSYKSDFYYLHLCSLYRCTMQFPKFQGKVPINKVV